MGRTLVSAESVELALSWSLDRMIVLSDLAFSQRIERPFGLEQLGLSAFAVAP
jgi:hypothetical protein